MSNVKKFTGNELVVKDTGFMQAAYSLDVVELRLVAMAIIVLRKESRDGELDLTAIPEVTLHASLYADLFWTTKNNAYIVLAKAADELMERKIQWVDVYEDKERNKKADRKNKLRWVSKCSYIDKLGVVQLTFSQDILPFLAHIHRHFATYEIKNLVKLKTSYEFRLYELGVAWKNTGKARFKKETLRQRLGILDEKHLADSSNFQRMLRTALKTVNRETDLNIELAPFYTRNPNTRGRFVSHYDMTVTLKKDHAHLLDVEQADSVVNAYQAPEAPEAPEAPKVAPKAPKAAPESPEAAPAGKALCAFANPDGSWDWDFIIANMDKPNFQIVGLDSNDVPDDILRKTATYKQFAIKPEFDLIGLGAARVSFIRLIVEMPAMASPAVKRKKGHGITELSNEQKDVVYNNKVFQSKYAPMGVSDWKVISRKLRGLLDGDLAKIKDLEDYL